MKKLLLAVAISLASLSSAVHAFEMNDPIQPTKLEKAKELAKKSSLTRVTVITSYAVFNEEGKHLENIYVYEDPLNPGNICRLIVGYREGSHTCDE